MVNASVEALGRKVEVKKVGTAVVKVARFPITPKERKLLDAPPARTLETYILRGKALQARQRGDRDKAAVFLEQATKKDATDAAAFAELGLTRMELADSEGAMDALTRALGLLRERGDEAAAARTLSHMARVNENINDSKEATRLFTGRPLTSFGVSGTMRQRRHGS